MLGVGLGQGLMLGPDPLKEGDGGVAGLRICSRS